MTALVEQLLTLARYDSGVVKPSIEDVSLCTAFREAALRLQPQIAERRITVNTSGLGECFVRADRVMTESIIENILYNAVKYSRDGGVITVSNTRENGRVLCSIQDNGMGMDRRVLPRVFDRFYRVDDARRSAPSGSGLGLAIVKKLADLQGLTIAIESEPQKGTMVSITFPSVLSGHVDAERG